MKFFNKIKKGLHIVKSTIKRAVAPSLPYVDEQKMYGNKNEKNTYEILIHKLPNADIIQNVCLDRKNAKGEIDFLIIFSNKVFIVELKSWKGEIFQEGNVFYQIKESQSGNKYPKQVSSPFAQLERNFKIIKHQFPYIYFEKLVLIINSDSVHISNEYKWFDDIDRLVSYIKYNGKVNLERDIHKLKLKIHSYDFLSSKTLFGIKENHCVIDDKSLQFKVDNIIYTRKNISCIAIIHKAYYDNIYLTLKYGDKIVLQSENKVIQYIDNGKLFNVGLNKLDFIKIG